MAEKTQQINQKHTPERSCVVCKTKSPKRSLTRLVVIEDELHIDLTGKMNGRGAYLCQNDGCWERAMKTHVLNQALKVTLSDEFRQQLLEAKPSS
ncbi:MAG: YlxR family protein [Phototrophicales bacterium]|nr:YlxR family protein [Phototrophicales bacterium]